MMKNKILSVMLCLIPFYVSYAIVSDFGKPQHHYHSASYVIPNDQDLSEGNISQAAKH